MKQALVYSLKVWLTSALLAPVLITLGMLIYSIKDFVEPVGDYFGFMIYFSLFGIAYTAPIFMLILALVVYLCKLNLTPLKQKLIILTFAELFISAIILGLQLWTTSHLGWNTLILWLPYTAVSACSIGLYNLQPVKPIVREV